MQAQQSLVSDGEEGLVAVQTSTGFAQEYIPLLTAAFLSGVLGGLLVSITRSPAGYFWLLPPAALLIFVTARTRRAWRDQARCARKALRLHEASLAEAKRQAEEANEAKDRFLAVLSHELRTPLTPVLSTAGMLVADPIVPDSIRGDLEVILRNTELEARLIDDLLDITRIVHGKLELRSEEVSLRDVLRHSIEICSAEAREKGVQLRADLSANAWMDGDPARLQQVFWNLVKNAVKFTPAGGTVRVNCRTEPAGCPGEVRFVFQVRDVGIGMDPEMISRLFDAFEQGGRETTRKFGGLGLGLAISRALVELHGGMLEGTSQGRGMGSTFTVRLPARARSACRQGQAKPALEITSSRARTLKILVVEDHADTARVLGKLLRQGNHEVRLAATLAEAHDAFEAERPELLISDLGLPDGTGLQLMQELQQRYGSVRAIALSGFGMDADIRRSRDAGFLMHLVKPVKVEQLHQAIAELTNEHIDL